MADPELNRISGSHGPLIVEIQTKDGKVHTKREEYCLGSPQKRFTWPEMIEKFTDCTSRAARPLPAENVKQVVDLVCNLERTEDATKIVKLLSRPIPD